MKKDTVRVSFLNGGHGAVVIITIALALLALAGLMLFTRSHVYSQGDH